MNSHVDAQTGNLPLRVVLLAMLLFSVNAWTGRHLGIDLREIAVVNTLLVFFYISIGVLAKEKEEPFRESVRQAFSRALTLPGLLALYIIVIALTSCISSVTILAAGVPGSISTLLSVEGDLPDERDRKQLQGPDGKVRYWTLTSPFGSSFYLLADGYLRKPIQLLPWIGATIRVSELQRLPSILVRIPYQQHGSLQDSELLIRVGANEPYRVKLAKNRASLLLGPDTFIPQSSKQNFRSELRTLANAPESLREVFFRNWIEPLRDESGSMLEPGQQVQVSFVTTVGKEVAQKTFTVGKSAFQDVLLINTGD